MKLLMTIVCAMTLSCVFAGEAQTNVLLKVGGKGKVAVVNTCRAPRTSLETAAKKLGNILMIDIEVKDGAEWKLADAKKCFDAAGANAAVFVVSDPLLPMSLVAVESKWGVVNAVGLDAVGVEKETSRVLASVLGGGFSKYPASVMRPAFSPEELISKTGTVVTFDAVLAIFEYLPALGVEPFRMMTKEDLEAEKEIEAANAAKK